MDEMPPWFSFYVKSSQIEFEANDFFGPTKFLSSWRGFQAFVYAADSTKQTTCPLDGKTFILKDNIEIIPITSSFYFPNNISEDDDIICNWFFEIPSGFKLKVHIRQISLALNEFLAILVDGNSIITNITTPNVQYFNGKNFTIIYKKIGKNIGAYGFGGIVTAVEDAHITTNICSYNNDNKFEYFYYANWTARYQNSDHCQSIHAIEKNQTYLLQYAGYVEVGVDNLTITDKFKNKFDITQSNYWIIDSKAENISLNFESDGSVNAVDFAASLKKIACTCSNKKQIIPCDPKNNSYGIFGISTDQNSYIYCAGMNCTYDLIPMKDCQNSSVMVFPRLTLRENSRDFIKIFKNETLLNTITANTKVVNDLFFEPTSTIRIEFQSYPELFGISKAPIALFQMLSLSNYKRTLIDLTPENFTFTLDLTSFTGQKLITVVAPKNYTLDLFGIHNLENYWLTASLLNFYFYDSNTTENFIGTFYDLPRHRLLNQMRHFTSITNSISIFGSSNFGSFATLFFRLREIHAKNCPSSDNVVIVSNTTISAKALTNGPCILTILYWNEKYDTCTEYKNIKTDAVDNVQFVLGVDPNIKFFEFNLQTMQTLPYLCLQGLSNSFIIPSNATINFISIGIRNYFVFGTISKGLLVSPLFVNPYRGIQWVMNTIFIAEGETCQFTVKFLDISDKALLLISYGESRETITHVNQTFKFFGSDHYHVYDPIGYIEYNEPLSGYRGYIVEFETLISAISFVKLNILLMFFSCILN